VAIELRDYRIAEMIRLIEARPHDFDEILTQARKLLYRHGRVSHNALKCRFGTYTTSTSRTSMPS